MKHFFRLLTAVFLICLASARANAQATFALINVEIIDTVVAYEEQIYITSLLSYTGGSQNYSGNLRMGIRTTQNGISLTNVVPSIDQTITNLQTGGTLDVDTGIVPVTSQYFLDGGGHTVIVWPILSSPTPVADIDTTNTYQVVEVTSWLSMQEWNTVKQAKIFPIPATDFLTMEKPAGKANITILDVRGRVVTAIFSSETQLQIPLSHLPTGTYFIRYSDGKALPEIHHFVKQ